MKIDLNFLTQLFCCVILNDNNICWTVIWLLCLINISIMSVCIHLRHHRRKKVYWRIWGADYGGTNRCSYTISRFLQTKLNIIMLTLFSSEVWDSGNHAASGRWWHKIIPKEMRRKEITYYKLNPAAWNKTWGINDIIRRWESYHSTTIHLHRLLSVAISSGAKSRGKGSADNVGKGRHAR